MTTRLVATQVDCVFLAYEEALKYLGKLKKYRIVGNPIKESLNRGNSKEAQKYFGLENGHQTILVFGGSQGARNINNAVDELLSTRLLKNVQIIWQTGEAEFDKYKEKYKSYDDINLCILPFIDRMDFAYSASTFAVTRAGAMTISELAATGLPAILVPYPYAAADHQLKNAQTIENEGAALLVEDNQDLAKNLSDVIFSVLESPEQIAEMADKMKKFHHENTLGDIEEELVKLIKNDDETKF